MKKTAIRGESGIIILEASLYFPVLLLAFFAFMMFTFYSTRQVILDRAVSMAAVEAAAELTDFKKDSVRINPYVAVIEMFSPPGGSGAFKSRVQQRVQTLAGNSMYDRGDRGLVVKVEYKNFFVGGELIVTAAQAYKIPINLSRFNVPEIITFRATAKAMVYDADMLFNDVDFLFELGNRYLGFDIGSIESLVSGLPDLLPQVH